MGSRVKLDQILSSMSESPGFDAHFQAGQNTKMSYPCIVYERDDSWTEHADNMSYYRKKRYSVTVIDKNPDSAIPDRVENLDYCRFVRSFKVDGLNHFVFQLFF